MVIPAGVIAALVFSLLTLAITGPLVYHDELIYMDGATSFAQGNGLSYRAGEYGYGPVYPMLVAIPVWLFEDRMLAYHVALVFNALIVASTVVQLFLLARRLLAPRAAAWAAVACLFVPTTFYAAYLMTDMLGYAVTLWAVLAIVRALERPTPPRQVVALAAIGAAVLVRPQMVLLAPTYAIAALLFGYIRGTRLVRTVRAHWVLTGAFAAGLLVVAVAGLAGRGSDLLGSYGALWRSVNLLVAAEWILYHVLDITLYLWILPAMLLPAAVVQLARRGRHDERVAAVVATVVALLVCALGVVGIFSATPFAQSRLHDRYLIFLFPLLVLLLAGVVVGRVWPARGVVFASAAAVVVLAALTPFAGLLVLETPNVFDGVATTPWAIAGEVVGVDEGVVSARTLMLASVVLAGLVALLAGERGRTRTLILCGCLIAATAAIQWQGAISISDRGTFTDERQETVFWIDRVAKDRPVTTLFIGTEACNEEGYLRAQLTSEFFNASVGPFVAPGEPYGDLGVRVRADGVVVGTDGRPAQAELVLTFPGVTLRGDVVARGTTLDLALWEVDGPITLTGGPGALAGACPKV